MNLNLPEHARTELFETQKYLIRTISIVSGFMILVAGAMMQLIYPGTGMGMPVRILFTFLFVLTAYIASRKTTSAATAEMLLAVAGASLLTRLLFQYHSTGFMPVQIASCTVLILTLSGVFINKTSLIVINFPSLAFLFFITNYPNPNQQYSPMIGFVFITIAAIVGYFMTWQKVYLLNKGLSYEAYKNKVIDNLHDGALLKDVNGRTLAYNQALCRLFSVSQEEFLQKVGHDPLGLFLKSDGLSPCPLEERPSTIAKATGKIVKDVPMVLKNSNLDIRHLDVTAIPIMVPDDQNTVETILITVRDVTDLKKAQETIENQKIHSLAHSKLTALGEMAAGIAHEINNPLTIIMGRTSQTQRMILSGKSSPEEISQNLEKISSTTMRIAKIVKSMKSLSRDSNSEEFQIANLKEIIDDIMTISNEYLVKNKISVQINIPEDISMECNPGLISQAFINLVNNAIDAIKETNDDRWIKAEAFVYGAQAIIHFYDSGPGIPPSLREKIMLPFFTTKEAGKGTGIGLSLIRTIVENHGGKFYINDSAPTTCFVIELPLIQSVTKMPQIKAA